MNYYSVSFNYPDDECSLEEYFNNAIDLRKLEPLPNRIESEDGVVEWLQKNSKNGIMPYQFAISQYSHEIDADGGPVYYGVISGEEFPESAV